MDEKAIETWSKIADLFNVHPRTMIRRRDELLKAGIIFYKKRRHGQKAIVSAFPSRLKDWMQSKSIEGKYF